MSTKGKQRLDLNEMNSMQLSSIRQQLEAEIELLEQSIQSLQNAKIKFNESAQAVDRQKDVADGSQILVPLTGSMYVPAVINDNNNFIVDIGTGYYVEKTTKAANDYFKRKVQFLSEQIDKYVKMTHEKVTAREAIGELLQYRQQSAQVAAQQSATTSQINKS
ncbi:prefoldin subunit 5-like [Oppia nitens]|uniref:prefoldin subunit 5-like n=1 Tax=Oppia nitens TaxID=1686743 RepID=UPI0023DCB3A1|nr:prefoldin subunit 5-like [Oppia nitens]